MESEIILPLTAATLLHELCHIFYGENFSRRCIMKSRRIGTSNPLRLFHLVCGQKMKKISEKYLRYVF